MNIQAISSRQVATDAQDSGAPAATRTSSVAQPTATASTPTSSSTPVKTDTVSISAAGRAALAEANETATQTAQEARNGDRQAIRLLAKQAQSHT